MMNMASPAATDTAEAELLRSGVVVTLANGVWKDDVVVVERLVVVVERLVVVVERLVVDEVVVERLVVEEVVVDAAVDVVASVDVVVSSVDDVAGSMTAWPTKGW